MECKHIKIDRLEDKVSFCCTKHSSTKGKGLSENKKAIKQGSYLFSDSPLPLANRNFNFFTTKCYAIFINSFNTCHS